jgi:cell division septation protein DedD
LDFLLYGSSIGVVTQETPTGLRVVAAGSFPVTKRMPFVTPAFDEAARRLAAHARCVVFVGPMVQEDGSAHPLASAVDLTIVVRSDDGVRRPRGKSEADAIEEAVTEKGVDVWSVRTGAEAKPAHAPEPAAPAAVAPPKPAAPNPAKPKPAAGIDAPPRAKPREREASPGMVPLDAPESRYGSLIPRIAVLVFALLVIGFVAWWMWQGRADRRTETASKPAASPAASSVGLEPIDTIAVVQPDSASTAATDSVLEPAATVPVHPGYTGGGTGGTVLVDPNDILVMDDLALRWNDWYAIHISSFQESIRAREEVSFLQSREFPVFIVFLDLGPKGKWYRVYAGPFKTREEAREVKKNLDAIPQVRFTRITKIPE